MGAFYFSDALNVICVFLRDADGVIRYAQCAFILAFKADALQRIQNEFGVIDVQDHFRVFGGAFFEIPDDVAKLPLETSVLFPSAL